MPASSGADRVVVFGIAHVGLDDLTAGRLPTLRRLADEGAVAATSVRTLSAAAVDGRGLWDPRCRARGSAVVDPSADVAVDADAALEGSTAAEVLARRAGAEPDGSIVVPAAPAVVEHAGATVSSEPGALGEALSAAGMATAVVANADAVERDGDGVIHRPAALAAIDGIGSIDAGTVRRRGVARGRHRRALRRPRRRRRDGRCGRRRSCGGASSSSSTPATPTAPPSTARCRRAPPPRRRGSRALARADELLARIVADAEPGTLLLVVGMTPVTSEWALTPTVAWGAGVPAGTTLHSPSTKREGLVTLTDVAPTILDALGVDTPDGMIGQPFRYHEEAPDLDALAEMDAHAASREGVYYPIAVTFIVVQALVYLLAVVILSQGFGTRVRRPLRFAVLVFAAWPLATFVERAIPGVEDLGDARQAARVGPRRRHRRPRRPGRSPPAEPALLDRRRDGRPPRARRRHRRQPPALLGARVLPAHRGPVHGLREHGLRRAGGVHRGRRGPPCRTYAPRPAEARWTAAGLFTVVLVADIWPTLGADVGGVLTMVPVFGLTMLALSGRRISVRAVAIALGATLAVLALVIVVDLLRPEDARTHLGRFVTGAGDDDTFLTTIQRKWSTNVRLFGRTIWTWMVPITAAFAVYVLVIARGWRRLLPPGRPCAPASSARCSPASSGGW